MPFTIKTTFAFAGQEQGWSEDFYWRQNTNDLKLAEAAITPLAQKRAKLLAKDYTLTIVRNAIVQNEAGAKVLRTTDIFEPRLPGVASWDSCTPNVALLVVWQNATNTASKKQYMRGIPAGIADAGKTADFTFGTFSSNFNSWRSSMIAFPAGWFASAVTSTAVINSYVIDPLNGNVTFTLGAPGFVWPVPFGVQTRVYVKLPGKSPLDGPILVVPTTATSCFTAKPIGVAPFVPGQIGTMQLRSPVLVTLASAIANGPTGDIHPQRIVTHKTGAPSYASRGRAPARARW